MQYQSLEAAFTAHAVARDLNQCWPWTGSVNNAGYGQLTYQSVKHWAHQLAYTLLIGEIIERDVCHSCDNRACVNPCHLFNDSRSENMKDAVRKGRVKLTPQTLDAIERKKRKVRLKAIEKAKRLTRMILGHERIRDSMGRFGHQDHGPRTRNALGQFGSTPSAPRKRDARGRFQTP